MGPAPWAEFKPFAQDTVDTIQTSAPDNLIIMGSPSWAQLPGEAVSNPLDATNLVLTAHIYPANWSTAFKNEVNSAVTGYPVFVTEWGSMSDDSSNQLYARSPTWGTDLQSYLDDKGASWTAWVADDAWQPPLFTSTTDGELTPFGTLVKDWLSSKVDSDWVE